MFFINKKKNDNKYHFEILKTKNSIGYISGEFGIKVKIISISDYYIELYTWILGRKINLPIITWEMIEPT